jgi:hypothetical protein
MSNEFDSTQRDKSIDIKIVKPDPSVFEIRSFNG